MARSATSSAACVFREPIICRKRSPACARLDASPSSSAATPLAISTARRTSVFAGAGKLTIKWEGADGEVIEHEVFEFPGLGGVYMGMYNLDDSIRDFARASDELRHSTAAGRSISRPRTPSSRPMTGASWSCSRRCSMPSLPRNSPKTRSIWYEHRLIDDMVACAMKWNGGFRLGLQELRWRRAVGHGCPGFRLARADGQPVLMTPDGKICRGRGGAWHGDAALPPAPEAGEQTSTNSTASIYRLDRRAETPRQARRATIALASISPTTLEKVVIETIESALQMTKDLALLVGPDQKWLTTMGYLEKVDENLNKALAG